MPAAPLKSVMYHMQLGVEERFQEPISIDRYVRGERQSDLLDLSVVNQIPISFVISPDDQVALPDYAEGIVNQFSNAEKFVRYEEGFSHD